MPPKFKASPGNPFRIGRSESAEQARHQRPVKFRLFPWGKTALRLIPNGFQDEINDGFLSEPACRRFHPRRLTAVQIACKQAPTSRPITPTAGEKRTHRAGWIQTGDAAPSSRCAHDTHETRRGRRVRNSPKLKSKTPGPLVSAPAFRPNRRGQPRRRPRFWGGRVGEPPCVRIRSGPRCRR